MRIPVTFSMKNKGHLLLRHWRFLNRRNASGPGFQEPDYLDALKPQYPVYDLLNVQIKSYDFPSLERFGSYVHRTAERMALNVEDCWATPHKAIHVRTYKPQSKLVDHEYNLNLYERNVQISQFRCSLVPIFLEVICANMPEGTQLSIHPHAEEHDEIRHIPDIELNDLKGQLDGIRRPSSK